MTTSFLGQGWRFPILPDATGRLSYTKEEENIEQSLRILLLTNIGIRVMRDDFGTRAQQLVFAPGSVQYLRLLEATVEDAVRAWEARVELLEVRAEADPRDEADVTVSVSYRIRRTNTRHNLVFPYYVGTLESP